MRPLTFPTELHRQATQIISDFFQEQKHVDTILLLNSLARGKATAESDIDIAVLKIENADENDISILNSNWQQFLITHPGLKKYLKSNRFAQIHLDIIAGIFEPAPWEDGGAVDFFEVEIGNRLLYSVPLTDEGKYFKKLKLQWLPYYNTTLQSERLKLSKDACLYELNHIPLFVKRGLYFQAFDRLNVAFQKFLQALFIMHKTYPIAYNKWIKEQVVEILNLPELYGKLPQIISVNNIESDELNEKAKNLNRLLDQYC